MSGEITGRTIGHAVRRYLPRSATFIHTLLRHQRRYRPLVLTHETENLDEFPVERLVNVRPKLGPLPRALGRARARAAGIPDTWDWRIVDAARRHDAVALHAHFLTTACGFLEARRHLGVPLVVTAYGFDLAYPDERPEWREPYDRVFGEAARFLCEGPAMAAKLAAIGAPRERVAVVKIGLDLDQFPFEPRRRDGPLILIQTGRFVEKKGIDTSIRAFAQARGRLDGDSELWLVGDGPERGRLEAEAERLGLGASVRFLGMLSHAGYRERMRRAHIGLQPSRVASDGDTEGGAPTVLLEMQASGMPLAATRHADIPAVVAHPEDLVPEDDAGALAELIVRLASISDEEWRARTEAGRALVEAEHDARTQAMRIETIYDEVL